MAAVGLALPYAWAGNGTFTNAATVIQRFGADNLALEAEDFYSETRYADNGAGFSSVAANSFTTALGHPVLPVNSSYPASRGRAIIADPRYGSLSAGHNSTVSYHLVFSEPGTYYFYYRESLFATNAASYAGNAWFYYSPSFGAAAATALGGSATRQDGSGTGQPVSNPFEGQYFWYQSTNSYTVTTADVGRTLVFNIEDGGLGLSLDRLVFSQNPNLRVTEPNALDVLPDSPFDGAPAVYSMSYVSPEETDAEISAREMYLQGVFNQSFLVLSNQIAGGQASAVISNLVFQCNQTTNSDDLAAFHTLMALPTYFPGLQSLVVSNLQSAGLAALVAATNAILTTTGTDLNATQPAGLPLNYAWVLHSLGSYFGSSAAQVNFRNSIESYVSTSLEGSSRFYTGAPYLTTGYNKEVSFMDPAALVTYLYQDRTNYPLTKSTFWGFWTNVTITSYDADNSPHYDAGTGFYHILNMGLRLGRTNDLVNSPHLKRIMDRMARTVENSGQASKWAKSMWSWYVSNHTDYLQLTAQDLQWNLKVGYLLWRNPFYLYVARKYEAFYLQNPKPFNSAYSLDLWPLGIDQFNVSLPRPQPADSPSQATPRISSRRSYNGFLLGRGDTNYQTVPDKLVLATGHHPRAPYLLMDLSFSQSKAAYEHRSGITTAGFNGAHTVTLIDRCGEPNEVNKVFLCPSNFSYPAVPVTSGQVTPTTNWYDVMGYSNTFAWTAYTNTAWAAGMLSSNAAFGTTDYAWYQYPGVGVNRQVVLLNNGVTVVADTLSTSNNYAGGHNGGTIWQVLPKAYSTRGSNWVLMTNLPKQLPFALAPGEALDSPTLIYFASLPSGSTITNATNPYDPQNALRNWFCAYRPLAPAQSFTLVSLLLPVANLNNYSNLLAGISTVLTTSNQTVSLPYGSRKYQQVTFAQGQPPGYGLLDLDPVLFSLPTNLVATALDSQGAPVAFVTSASNHASGLLPTTSAPASGSLFLIGRTPVTVTAVDSGGDVYTTTFSVTVLPPPGNPPGFAPPAIAVTGGAVSLTATGAPGTPFTLWTSTNLALKPVTSTWTKWTSGIISSSPFVLTTPGVTTNQGCFYLLSTP